MINLINRKPVVVQEELERDKYQNRDHSISLVEDVIRSNFPKLKVLIGLTSIWTYALGLAPFKDTFWTVPQEPGNKYGDDRYEAFHDLEAVMATLSTGTVGISDKIGLTNMTLVNKSIRADGLVLKPSAPISMPDYATWDIKLNPIKDKHGRNWRDINTTSIFETYTSVSGIKWGIMVEFNPGADSMRNEPISHYMNHYKFSRDQPFETYFVSHVTLNKV